MSKESFGIAESLAKLHSVSSIKTDIVIWSNLDKWYQMVLNILSRNSKLHDIIKNEIDIYSFGEDIRKLKSMVNFNSVVFSHNDLQYGNIMKHTFTNNIIFIDYEYGGSNYLEYDIANFFCEWMADYHSSTPHLLDKTKYPSTAQQELFIMHYLKSKHPEKYNDELINDQDVILKRIPIFTLCSHLIWGLWGIINGSNTAESTDFDYILYGLSRLSMFKAAKENF